MNKRMIATIIVSFLIIASGILLIADKQLQSNEGVWKEVKVSGRGDSKIVQIPIEGPILGESGEHRIISMLNKAMKDKSVTGVVLSVNSPGGDVVTVDEIHTKIKQLKGTGRVVVSSMGSIAASGGYYVSAAADHIYANPSTITGSLGVVISLTNYKELAEKIGYSQTHIVSGPFKDIADPLRELKSSERDIYQAIVDESYEQFVQVIMEGRGMDKASVQKIADGRVYSGKQAKQLGLIDEYGTVENAVEFIKKQTGVNDAQFVRYEMKSSFLGLLKTSAAAGDLSSIEGAFSKVVTEVMGEGPQLQYILR